MFSDEYLFPEDLTNNTGLSILVFIEVLFSLANYMK